MVKNLNRMNRLLLVLIVAGGTAPAFAQHSDVELVIEGGAIVVEPSGEGHYVFEGDLEPLGGSPMIKSIAEPGF